jgi:hypothetical protein
MAKSSEKSRGIALILGIVLGVFGAHRFYVGKAGTGVLMLCTAGGLGIWYLIDVIMIASGGFRDAEGRRVLRWDPGDDPDFGELPQEVIEELVSLRREVNELAERLDFAERLLADPARRG